MEVEHNPRKRKRAPNAISGRLTRSKSLVYSHLNRSGRFRRDSSTNAVTSGDGYWQRRRDGKRRNVKNGVCFADEKLKSSNPAAGGEAEVKPSTMFIKDLRSRRVFSRPLVVGEQEPKKPVLGEGDERIDFEMSCSSAGEDSAADLVDGENPNASKSVELRSLDEDAEIRARGEVEEKLGFLKVEGSPPNCRELGDISPTLSNEKGGKCSSNLNSVNNLECEQIFDEENVQTTPPDPDIVAQQKCNLSKSEQDACGTPRMPSICRKDDSALRRKLVLNPCARLKVFKAPSSVSYRRLLPYLMDIAKDKSYLEDETLTPKCDAALKEKIESDGCKAAKETQPGDSINQMATNPISTNSSGNIMSPTLAEPGSQIEVPSPSNSPRRDSPRSGDIEMVLNPCARLKVFKDPSSVSYRKLLPYLMDVAKDKSCALEIKSHPKIEVVLEEKPVQKPQVPLTKDSLTVTSDFEDDTLSSIPTLKEKTESDGSDVAKEVQPSDSIDPDSQIEVPSQSNSPQGDSASVDPVSSPKSGETDMVLDNISPIDEASKALQCTVDQDCKLEANAIAALQSSPPFKAALTSEVSNAGASRGILRRNPRGCRGLCTCLNCSSFRLHAERAFEFSKNQMQDTEEIVLGLTDELSQLRNVLEKSLEDSNAQANLVIDQVKEVCLKASKAEETARIRLDEMNEDLFIHCRTKSLQRPRVSFAINTEGNVSNDASPLNK